MTKAQPGNRAKPEYLVIGRIIKPHGIRGEVSVKVLTDFGERFATLESVLVGDDESAELYEVKSTRQHKQHVLVLFDAIQDRTEAETLRGRYLKVPLEEAILLEADVYYHHQLIGLRAITEEGEPLGILTEILETGANDVYIVQGEKGEILLPATNEVIPIINLERGEIIVHLIEGLL